MLNDNEVKKDNKVNESNTAENQSEGLDIDFGDTVENHQILDLQTKMAELSDKYLRSLADIENMRKRSDAQVESANKFAVSNFAKALLPTLDIFNKVLQGYNKETADANLKNIIVGIEMTKKEFEKALEKFGIKKIDALNNNFDANLHEALSFKEDKTKNDGVVCEVYEEGYVIFERLLRPSKVVVVKNN
jgi:molecular chaperone GrpE